MVVENTKIIKVNSFYNRSSARNGKKQRKKPKRKTILLEKLFHGVLAVYKGIVFNFLSIRLFFDFFNI